MNKIKRICISLMLLFCMIFSSFGEVYGVFSLSNSQIHVDITVHEDNELVTVKGRSIYESKIASIMIWSGNKKYYIDNTNTDEKGNFKFEFRVKNHKDYKGKINIENGIKEFTFSTEESSIPVERVTINKTSVNLEVGESERLEAIITPENASNKKVLWSSSYTDIVSVDQEGNIIANNAGQATVMVMTEDGNKTSQCSVEVFDKEEPTRDKPKYLKIENASEKIKVGDKPSFTAKVYNENHKIIENAKIIWTVDKEEIGRMDKELSNKFITLSSGTAVITAALEKNSDIKDSITIHVDENIKEVYMRIEGYDKTILPRTKIQVPLYDISKDLSKEAGKPSSESKGWGVDEFNNPTNAHAVVYALKNICKMHQKDKGEEDSADNFEFKDCGWSLYAAMIGGDRERDQGDVSGWMYRVNDALCNTGSNNKELRDGDEIVWFYSAYGGKALYTKLKADKTSIKVGEKIKLALEGCIKENKVIPVEGAAILVNKEEYLIDGKGIQTDKNGNAVLSFDEEGTYEISAVRYKYRANKKEKIDIIRPLPLKITVTNSGSGGETETDKVKPVINTDLTDLSTNILDSDVEEITFTVKVQDNKDKNVVPTVTVRGKILNSVEGKYSLKIYEGKNKVIIEACDKAGNKTKEEIIIFKKMSIKIDDLNEEESNLVQKTQESLNKIQESMFNGDMDIDEDNTEGVNENQNSSRVLDSQNMMKPDQAEQLERELRKNNVNLEDVNVRRERTSLIRDSKSEIMLIIPAKAIKAVDDKKKIRIIERQDELKEEVISSVYELNLGDEKEKTEFDKPVVLTIKIPIRANQLENISLAWFNEKTGQWIPIPAVIDSETGLITGIVNHFTKFAVIDKSILFDKKHIYEDVERAIEKTANYLIKDKGYSSDWEVVGLLNAGKPIPKEYITDTAEIVKDYFDNVMKTKKERITEYERIALGIAAAGGEPRNIGGHDLIERVYNFEDFEGKDIYQQGLNGVIYGLLALDSKKFKIPHDAKYKREDLIKYIMEYQNIDGGWDLGKSGDYSDVDITAMALAALAPYKNSETKYNRYDKDFSQIIGQRTINDAIEAAVDWLSRVQNDKGGYISLFDQDNSESISQAIIGLCANGVDPTSSRFTKNEYTLIAALLSFNNGDGTFLHVKEPDSSMPEPDIGMATEQALLALTAYKKFVDTGSKYNDGKTSIYYFGKENHDDDKVKVEQIKLNKSRLTLKKGQSETLTAEVLPRNAADKRLVWKSTDSETAFVDQKGKITARKAGSVKIRVVTYDGSKIAECIVIVETDDSSSGDSGGSTGGTSGGSSGGSSGGTSGGTSKGSNDKTVSVYITVKGYEGTIVPRTKINVGLFDLNPYLKSPNGSSASKSKGWGVSKFTTPTNAHAIVKLLNDENINYSLQDYGWSLYMSMIDEEAEFDYGPLSGWMYAVNGKLPATGSNGKTLENGDEIVWFYGAYGFDTIFTNIACDKKSVETGETVKVNLKGVVTKGANGKRKSDKYSKREVNVEDAVILVNGEEFEINGEVLKTDSKGNVELTFNEPGKYTISAVRYKYKRGEREYIDIIRPNPVTINVKGEAIDNSNINKTKTSIKIKNGEKITLKSIQLAFKKAKGNKDKFIEIEVDNNSKHLNNIALISLDALEKINENDLGLIFKSKDAVIELPERAVDMKDIKNNELDKSYLEISFELVKLHNKENENLAANKSKFCTIIGNVVDFKISIMKKDGTKHQVKKFAANKKTKISINLKDKDLQGKNISRLSAYYFKQGKNKWINVGGKYIKSEKNLVFNVRNTGKFALMEDKDNTVKKLNTKKASPNKVWEIKFNDRVDKSTVNGNRVIIEDSKGNKLKNLKFDLSKDGKSVLVQCNKKYNIGETYTIYISKEIKSKENHKLLKENIEMKFIVVE
jgi:uncharacterized protein YjdB